MTKDTIQLIEPEGADNDYYMQVYNIFKNYGLHLSDVVKMSREELHSYLVNTFGSTRGEGAFNRLTEFIA